MDAPVSARAHRLRRRIRAALLALALAAVLAWSALPAARAVLLVGNWSHRGTPDPTRASLPVRSVTFAAADGVRLAGWFALASPAAPTVVLVHGFKGTRADMLPWARFLFAAGYNVLLYDSRGCGQSAGWGIALGAREADDIIGAVRYVRGRADLTSHEVGALGISLGAGDVLLAAAREPGLAAVVADSAWTDEHPQIDRMGAVPAGPLALPVPPYEPALVDALIGARLEATQPLRVIARIAPRALLLIHSADDGNATTPLAGERALFAAAGAPKAQWIAPSGGHAGAMYAHPADYQRQVLAFFGAYLGRAAGR
jgi:uncharacterized protein